jgi:hypothetical protein
VCCGWRTPLSFTTTICTASTISPLLSFSTTHCSLQGLLCNVRHQASPRESTQRRKVELWARNVREFWLNADLYVTFRGLLHAVKLRRLYFPSEGRCAEDFFFRHKNPTASVGCEPANLSTKGQHATSRPPKPLTCQ